MNDSLRSHPPLLKYLVAQTASQFAFQMTSLALGWQLYDLTGSALDLGLVGLAQFVPAVALTLVVGELADRSDRRRILVACMSLYAAVCAVLIAGGLGHWLSREIILACTFVLGVARAFDTPCMQSLLPLVVNRDLLPRAVASSSGSRQAATLTGPALAGVVYIAGPEAVYGLSLLFFLGAGVLVMYMQVSHRAANREPVSLQSLFGGLVYVRRNPVVLGALSLDLLAVLLGGVVALLPIYAKDILDTGSWGLGLLRSSPAIGALAMAAWLSNHPLQNDVGRKLFVSVMLYGLFVAGFGLSSWLPLSMLLLVLMGAADMVSQVIRHSLVQLNTPDQMRGRVTSINSLFTSSSSNLGQLRAGVTAAWWGAVPAVVVGGVGVVVMSAAWMKLFPVLVKRQRLHEG